MKKNPSLFGFVVAMAAFAAAFGVYFLFLSKPNYYLVDNPTGQTYYFRVNNGDEKILSAGQFLKVDLPRGKNEIKVYDENKKLVYDSSFTVNKVRGLVNITHSDYYIHRQYYGYGVKKDSLIEALPRTEIDGKVYYGGAKKFNGLYTDDFYYNIDEDYDRVVKNIDKVESRVKIFRKQDFLNYYNDYYKF
ncbi:hypothetical protein [Bergeyella sp. RCAD1439]|uniref:hypothetical protein n=1 Tax=Bergeyella anatis TaxID=3113737 RepID=UPI002E17F722|nr:hypothetical protein [Bergeyella sp. RCAD1439]